MKLLKQASTMVLASTLLLTAAPAVWAADFGPGPVAVSTSAFPGQVDASVLDAKITKEQAIERAKTYITLPADYSFQSIGLNAYYGMNGKSVPTWNISYVKKVKDRYYGSANIAINGLDGTLVSYSMNDNDPDHKLSYPPKVDYQAAKELAAAFVAKVNPSKQKELLYNDTAEKAFRTPLDGNYQYGIRYDRSVGGIPYAGNGLNVSVNGDGQITNYNYNWDDNIVFDQTSTPISKEKAAQLFHDKLDLSLQYQIPYNTRGKKLPIISYFMNSFDLDATTGEVSNPFPQQAVNKPLTDKPLGDKPTASLNLTKEEAVKKITTTFNLSSEYKLQEANYSETKDPETGETTSTWNMSWNKPVTDSSANSKMVLGSNVWANVNSKTGEITNFNFYVPYTPDNDKPVVGKISLDDAISKSNNFVKAQLPASTDQLVLSVQKDYPEDVLKQMRVWEISYKRVIDGVAANNEEVRVSIDRVTGEITNYYANLSSVAYPATKPAVISVDKAKDLWLAQYDIRLNYVAENDGYMGGLPIEKYKVMMAAGELPMSPVAANKDGQVKAKLVYSLISKNSNREAFLLDAESGQWRSAQSGDAISLEKITVSDIDNHWARNELQLMLDYQALDVTDGKVNPDQTIKRGELVKMLVIAMNGGNGGIYYGAERKASFADVSNSSPYFAYVENAVDRGLIDVGSEFNPEAKMDREAMAQLIVKALGYQNLAKYDGVFNNQFADAGKLAHLGDAAIVVGLNIMSLTDGAFAPQAEVTKAQAASAFFRFLQRRAELQDQPRYYY
ncbi:YcdB/YcdC domain-containing protein [Paenibacillus pectinilyticus]|uniref:YcdB/YcdC domain-containing protein n=1 Tax=Paenibacillus pectinilyticus TaxID=512399 RepID=UPI000A672C26|nr:YcdB/YcdC domain-containing protein [Paenibacillus pectinilyticus]